MDRDSNIRTLQRDDLAGVRLVLDGTGLFPSEMLGEMAEPFLSGRAPHFWIVAVRGEETVGFAYCEPERLTEGTYNLLAIAVAPDHQRSGSGTALVRGIEALLRGQGGRLLLVEPPPTPIRMGLGRST